MEREALEALVEDLAQRVARLEERERAEAAEGARIPAFELLHRGFVGRIREEET